MFKLTDLMAALRKPDGADWRVQFYDQLKSLTDWDGAKDI